ncbi:hypothetical protein JCM10449v2_002622 [Rhodotorula kratochvilovae]
MLLRLPPELVTLVLEHLWTEEDWTREDRQGQCDLARCCRVSKALCTLAQPVLWRHVYLDIGRRSAIKRRAVDPEHIKPGLAVHARTLAVSQAPTAESAATLASRHFDLQQLSYMHNLHSLYLPDRFVCAPPTLLLDRLVVLELVDVVFDPPDLLSSLTPVHLPSLRALLLLNRGNSTRVLNPALLAQLDCVQAEVASSYDPPQDARTPTLFLADDEHLDFAMSLEWSAARVAKVRHLGCFDLGMTDTFTLSYLIKMLRQTPNLKTLWLPKTLQSCSNETSASLARRLLALCQERRVLIFWIGGDAGYYVNRRFWEYAKELKARGEQLSVIPVATTKGKQPEEIRKLFNIVNDFTPEEEAQIKKENEWAEDRAPYDARAAALASGIPETVPLQIINRFCSSGLTAVANIANQIRNGEIEIGLAVGLRA